MIAVDYFNICAFCVTTTSTAPCSESRKESEEAGREQRRREVGESVVVVVVVEGVSDFKACPFLFRRVPVLQV